MTYIRLDHFRLYHNFSGNERCWVNRRWTTRGWALPTVNRVDHTSSSLTLTSGAVRSRCLLLPTTRLAWHQAWDSSNPELNRIMTLLHTSAIYAAAKLAAICAWIWYPYRDRRVWKCAGWVDRVNQFQRDRARRSTIQRQTHSTHSSIVMFSVNASRTFYIADIADVLWLIFAPIFATCKRNNSHLNFTSVKTFIHLRFASSLYFMGCGLILNMRG